MRSPYNFIVKPIGGKRYNNSKSIGGIDLIISTSEEDHRFSNRYAEVIETPLKYDGPYDRYCFVKPVPVSDSYIFKPFSEEPLVGLMKYPSKYLTSKGVNKGDMVTFAPESEYEFTVDDEKLYRIYDHQISMVI